MKVLLVLVIAIVAGLLIFNYVSTGTFSLLPGHSEGGEMAELNQLQGEFMAAARQYRQAGRAAAVSGIDSTADAEAAFVQVNRVQTRVEEIEKKSDSEEARERAREILKKIRSFTSAVS